MTDAPITMTICGAQGRIAPSFSPVRTAHDMPSSQTILYVIRRHTRFLKDSSVDYMHLKEIASQKSLGWGIYTAQLN